jgi:hypothetical protein
MHGRLQGRTVRIRWGIAGGCSNRREECYDFQRIKDTPSGSKPWLVQFEQHRPPIVLGLFHNFYNPKSGSWQRALNPTIVLARAWKEAGSYPEGELRSS